LGSELSAAISMRGAPNGTSVSQVYLEKGINLNHLFLFKLFYFILFKIIIILLIIIYLLF